MKERADAPRLISVWAGLEITASYQLIECLLARLSGNVTECTITEVIGRKGRLEAVARTPGQVLLAAGRAKLVTLDVPLGISVGKF